MAVQCGTGLQLLRHDQTACKTHLVVGRKHNRSCLEIRSQPQPCRPDGVWRSVPGVHEDVHIVQQAGCLQLRQQPAGQKVLLADVDAVHMPLQRQAMIAVKSRIWSLEC